MSQPGPRPLEEGRVRGTVDETSTWFSVTPHSELPTDNGPLTTDKYHVPSTFVIFDTTLRDGEQSPGCSMNLDEKLEVAQALVDLGVDIIEAGFPIASPGDFEAVREIADNVRGATICGLARCNDADIDRAWEALKHAADAADSRLPGHQRHPSRVQAQDGQGGDRRAGRRRREAGRRLLRRRRVLARRRRPHRARLPLPGGRGGDRRRRDDGQHPRHRRLRHAGRTTAASSRRSSNRVPNIDKAVISVHCHNDLGLAVANSLAAVENGAGQIECTINGIGERAGNCSLEEVVMALRTRHDYYHCRHAASTRRGSCPPAGWSRSITGMHVQRNKAIVGRNAFAHEAGIHQDGMLKERTHLRDHAARGRRLRQDRPGAGQAQRPGRAGRPGQGAGLPPHRRAAADASSTSSRSWPTRRRTSTTATSPP